MSNPYRPLSSPRGEFSDPRLMTPPPPLYYDEEIKDDAYAADLNEADRMFLHKQLDVVTCQYKSYLYLADAERKKANQALRNLQHAKGRLSDLEEDSWRLSNTLGITDPASYLGLV